MKKKFYKKWWFWVIIVVVIVAAVSSGLSEGGNKSSYKPNSLEEEWILTPHGKDAGSSYPDVMNLNSDGTGVADGKSLTWKAEDGVLHLYIGSADLDYSYRFDNDKLYLNQYEYTRPDYAITPPSNLINSVWIPDAKQTLLNGNWVDNPTITISDIADDGSYISIVDQKGNTYTGTGNDSNGENIMYNGSAEFYFENDIPFNRISILGMNERGNQPMRIHTRYIWNGIGDGVDYYPAE
ncbi:MAG: hypothetical protein IJF61_05385 [Clostridia bacterium]|nr:hypothetical protein [Clostridia bacterium]